jgi:hypothetical protein
MAWGGLGVREVVLRGALVDTEKNKKNKEKNNTFFRFFSGAVGMILDGGGIR